MCVDCVKVFYITLGRHCETSRTLQYIKSLCLSQRLYFFESAADFTGSELACDLRSRTGFLQLLFFVTLS